MSHTARMGTSGLPVPDAVPMFKKLEEDLYQEIKFKPNLKQLPNVTQVKDYN